MIGPIPSDSPFPEDMKSVVLLHSFQIATACSCGHIGARDNGRPGCLSSRRRSGTPFRGTPVACSRSPLACSSFNSQSTGSAKRPTSANTTAPQDRGGCRPPSDTRSTPNCCQRTSTRNRRGAVRRCPSRAATTSTPRRSSRTPSSGSYSFWASATPR